MKNLLALCTIFVAMSSFASSNGALLHGPSLRPVSLSEMASRVQPGSIVLLGENHYLRTHQAFQLKTMKTLREQGLTVAVGMEFFYFPDQPYVDSWRTGEISDDDFLTRINWGEAPFEFYKHQALFPQTPAKTVALNAPRFLTRKISQTGLESLTDEERSLLPPNFALGNESYKKRFLAQMPHTGTEKADRYFMAQSAWDDTMAFHATQYIQNHPDHVMVIVVGEFHVQYDGGLPDRIRARAPHIPVSVISQINRAGLSDEELRNEILPSPEFGVRADFLFISNEESR